MLEGKKVIAFGDGQEIKAESLKKCLEAAGAQGTTAAGKAAARVAMHRRCADAVRRILPALPSLPDEMRRGTRPAVREWPR